MVSRSQHPASNQAQHVIKSAIVTEKTTHIAEKYNCFVLEVSISSSKTDIQYAVEESWGVRVMAVRTQMRVSKTRRHKAIIGASRQKKLAFITLHSDDRLNFL